jgi:hypothetical protein
MLRQSEKRSNIPAQANPERGELLAKRANSQQNTRKRAFGE